MGSIRMIAIGMSLAGSMLAPLGAGAADEGTWETFKSYAHSQKNQAVAAAKTSIAEADKKIAELKRQTQQSGAEARAAHERNMSELEQKNRLAQAELVKLEKAGGKAWDATKAGVSSAYSELQKAYDKAAASAKP